MNCHMIQYFVNWPRCGDYEIRNVWQFIKLSFYKVYRFLILHNVPVLHLQYFKITKVSKLSKKYVSNVHYISQCTLHLPMYITSPNVHYISQCTLHLPMYITSPNVHYVSQCTLQKLDGFLQLIWANRRNNTTVCIIPTHRVATLVYWMGLLDVNHPFIRYSTLIKRNAKNLISEIRSLFVVGHNWCSLVNIWGWK
jgi:hypothetical protein